VKGRGRFGIAAVLCAVSLPALAADPCEPHRKRYGDHPLTVAGALALHAKQSTPSDADMQCLETIWTPRDGTLAAAATRGLLLVVSSHPIVAIEAVARRPSLYREWLEDAARYGIHDVNGEGRLLRSSITALIAAKPANDGQEQARKLLLDGLGAVRPFKFG
jgi:hypothetical protein